MNDADENRIFKNILEEAIAQNWNILAAYAWQRYRSEGRGFVLLDFTQGVLIASQASISLDYVPLGDERMRNLETREQLENILNGYDTEREFVLGAAQPNVGTRFAVMRADDRLTPREAFEAGHAPRGIRPGLN